MATLAYFSALVAAALFASLGTLVGVALFVLVAGCLVYRFELRKLLDRTPLTRYEKPRPVPPPRTHLRTRR